MKSVLTALLLFPLAGAVFNVLVGRFLSRKAVNVVSCAAVVGSLAMSVLAILAGPSSRPIELYHWFGVGDFSADVTLLYDSTAAVMVVMVTFVASIIHVYSTSFMREDEDYARYFTYLNLFVFAMLAIALADNLIFVYLGWEGVGFCSYGLIGFWYDDPKNAAAGRKAFILTRIGDVGFGIGLAVCYQLFQTFSITRIDALAPGLTTGMATLLGLLFLWAALGKSAQLPLSVWLPDAMAGPTPVSALIHAATMVTAGIYLLIRLFPVLHHSPTVLLTATIIGAVTALYAAFSALVQTDIKRLLAYSTISQVAFMLLAVGAGDIVGSLFLLVSHAFFKSLLFLTAGCVIQALSEEHDIFRMGNLKRYMPGVYWLTLIGSLCLSAFPLVGGFFSKDRILLALFLHPEPIYKFLWLLAFVGAILTPLYTMRMFFTAFPNRSGGRSAGEVKPIPKLMVGILWPLAILSLLDGLLNLPFGPGKHWLALYLSTVPGALVDLGAPVSLDVFMGILDGSFVLAMVGWSWFLFRPPFESMVQPKLRDWLFSGFNLDVLYAWLFVRPYRSIADFLWKRMDQDVLDGTIEGGANGLGFLSLFLGRWNTGRVSGYLKMLLLGFAATLCALALAWFSR